MIRSVMSLAYRGAPCCAENGPLFSGGGFPIELGGPLPGPYGNGDEFRTHIG
jgi:hypothetical protein